MNSRRGFLTGQAAVIAGAALDPDKLLWVPGQRMYSIPAVVKPKLSDIRRYGYSAQVWTAAYFAAAPGPERLAVASKWGKDLHAYAG